MKAETDMDPLEVPPSLVRKWGLKPEDGTKKADIGYRVIEMLGEVEGTVVPYDEGRFLIDFILSKVPAGGGYPKEASMKVGEVEVVAFGWSSELEENHEAIHILGLKDGKQ